MRKQPKILILYARFGNGHYQAAKALQEQFAAREEADVRLVDALEEAHPRWNACSKFVYDRIMARCPRLYGWSYDATRGIPSDAPLGRWLYASGHRRVQAILEEQAPDAVIQTFPFAAMRYVRRTPGRTVPSFTVITDYVLHGRWIHRDTDGYFVATEALKQELSASGVDAARIRVTGIPVRPAFREASDHADRYSDFGLDANRRYVLAMAQSEELVNDIARLLAEGTTRRHALSFLLVCGGNGKLFRKAVARFKGEPDIRVFGYVEHMERLMSASSCIITKAGGITLTEALALRLPVIVTRPLPGQEKGNADYWAARNAIRVAGDLPSLRSALRDIAEGRVLSARQAPDSPPSLHASRTIAQTVLNRLSEAGQEGGRDRGPDRGRLILPSNAPGRAFTEG
ncbi:processive 1,2-diacylglycerol beta-glucosyltransferase [Paenibacillus sp. UNC496MF]|uniref:MGDG synthase family glycosyltransferase n=1 Tax=Paenibacillus sp. UNC496MF TaxID=1502753 RepID=UPI0008EAF856|nr:glycosyltransferase [Paenibacillus sp. UNC496MF]SFI41580.1 processive 1,2-diacylglycerol beta-glucosyltransferase [Paenibacillus sp. UNC496MF]